VLRRKTISPPPRSRASRAPRSLRACLRFPKKRERKGLFCMVNMLFFLLLVAYFFPFSNISVDHIWLSRFERPLPAFERLALSSSQLFRRLLARRISERSDDRKYVFVCRLVVCMTELLIYRPFQFYSEKNFEFTSKSLDHSASGNSKKHSTYTEQIRN